MSSLIRGAITHPIAVLAIVLAMILFGLASLQTIPIQMTPDIDKPVLQVRVSWPGASPKDVEREIVLRLERELTSLPGVQSVVSDSRRGRARVTLTYGVGQDMDAALQSLADSAAGGAAGFGGLGTAAAGIAGGLLTASSAVDAFNNSLSATMAVASGGLSSVFNMISGAVGAIGGSWSSLVGMAEKATSAMDQVGKAMEQVKRIHLP